MQTFAKTMQSVFFITYILSYWKNGKNIIKMIKFGTIFKNFTQTLIDVMFKHVISLLLIFTICTVSVKAQTDFKQLAPKGKAKYCMAHFAVKAPMNREAFSTTFQILTLYFQDLDDINKNSTLAAEAVKVKTAQLATERDAKLKSTLTVEEMMLWLNSIEPEVRTKLQIK